VQTLAKGLKCASYLDQLSLKQLIQWIFNEICYKEQNFWFLHQVCACCLQY